MSLSSAEQKKPDEQKKHPQAKAKPAAVEVTEYAQSVPKPTFSQVKYGDHARNVLDFWQVKSTMPTPLVLVIHGGGWMGGSKERIDRCVDVKALMDAGISVAAINYRFIPQATADGISPPVRGPLLDAARALQFLRSKSKEWNIAADRVGLSGSSAGACSSLWLAFHNDLADPNSSIEIERQSTRPQHVAVLNAQCTLDPQQAKQWIPNSTYGGHAFGKKNFAAALADRESLIPWINEYSPYALMSKDDTPVAIFYSNAPNMGKAQKDPTHSANHGIGLQEHGKSIGVDCEVIHPGIKNAKYKSATQYLIEKLNAIP